MNEIFIANYSGGVSDGLTNSGIFVRDSKELWSMAIDSTGISIVHNPGMVHHFLKGQPSWGVFYQKLHSTSTGTDNQNQATCSPTLAGQIQNQAEK